MSFEEAQRTIAQRAINSELSKQKKIYIYNKRGLDIKAR